jgi:pimeloyl-ACP methyl ester carboxylesterase
MPRSARHSAATGPPRPGAGTCRSSTAAGTKRRAHAAQDAEQRAPAAAAGYYADGAFDPAETKLQLTKVTAPVLVLAGEVDLGPTPELAAEAAALFPAGQLAVQPGASHYPWIDDPRHFTATLATFLTAP